MATDHNPALVPAHFEIRNRENRDPDWSGRLLNVLAYDDTKAFFLSGPEFNEYCESENYRAHLLDHSVV